ncbi:MAG: DnaA N-terminal domain-containing protein, partial [Shinella zoogloeoides]|uniref:DnaA N-terminal domain-containing protein n=1 Tax=Shinella zoogloeoides TaxID=352475 RepID=UPI003C739BEC
MKGGKMQMNTARTAGAFANGENARQTLPQEGAQEAAGVASDMKHDALFERVSARLKAQVGPDVFASWFGRLKIHSVSKSVVRLSVPTTFLKSWINNRYLDLITSLFQQEDAEILKVEILVRTATRGVRIGVADDAVAVAEPAPQAQP